MLQATTEVLAARAKWRYRGEELPRFAIEPRAGQESVWNYPRPPRIEADRRRVCIRRGEALIADTDAALRVLETASPPTFYVPPKDVATHLLQRTRRVSQCEWKGVAVEFDCGDVAGAAWAYLDTYPEFSAIAGYYAFYPAKLHCRVDGEPVQPQPGGYYGGWITAEVVGPFKGEPGSMPWW